MHLDKPEFFITFIFEDFSEKKDVVVVLKMLWNCVYYGRWPFDDKIL